MWGELGLKQALNGIFFIVTNSMALDIKRLIFKYLLLCATLMTLMLCEHDKPSKLCHSLISC